MTKLKINKQQETFELSGIWVWFQQYLLTCSSQQSVQLSEINQNMISKTAFLTSSLIQTEGREPTLLMRLLCSSDWLKKLPISLILTDPSMQRVTQAWYWSRSGSWSQKILKASHTVSWHTETPTQTCPTGRTDPVV